MTARPPALSAPLENTQRLGRLCVRPVRRIHIPEMVLLDARPTRDIMLTLLSIFLQCLVLGLCLLVLQGQSTNICA
jgi:hypothetical protein